MAENFERARMAPGSAEPGDAELVEAWRQGDGAALERLVRRHQSAVYRLMLRAGGNPVDAEDLTQKTFLKAVGRLRRLDQPHTFRTWLFRIALNLARNRRRNARRWRSTELDPELRADPGRAADDDLVQAEREARVRAAIEHLPKRQREVVHLRLYAEMPFKEVAEVLGTSENSAKVSYHHAVRALKARLTEDTR